MSIRLNVEQYSKFLDAMQSIPKNEQAKIGSYRNVTRNEAIQVLGCLKKHHLSGGNTWTNGVAKEVFEFFLNKMQKDKEYGKDFSSGGGILDDFLLIQSINSTSSGGGSSTPGFSSSGGSNNGGGGGGSCGY